jgi:molybdopterin molybdotransferase
MNSVSETKKIIASSLGPLPSVTLPVLDAFGFALVDDLMATQDLPVASQANADGYAIKFSDVAGTLAVQALGDTSNVDQQTLGSGQALPVTIGQPLPDGADTVVTDQGISFSGTSLTITPGTAMPGMNVKPKGSESAKGELLMSRGERLSAAAIGFLAGKGINQVTIYRPPVISIINVATHQAEPGKDIGPGQSFEANTYLLRAAARQCNLSVHRVFRAEPVRETLGAVVQDAVNVSDIVIIVGCFTKEAKQIIQATVEDQGVDELVDSVKQSPGGSMYFGCSARKAVFILPGGPASVLTCFYEYIVQTIEIMTRKKNIVPVIKASLAGPYQKPAELTYFLSGNFAKGRVTPVLSPAVSGIHSFVSANCLIILPEEEINFQIGEEVEVHLLP